VQLCIRAILEKVARADHDFLKYNISKQQKIMNVLKGRIGIFRDLRISIFESIRSHPPFRVSPKPRLLQNTLTHITESALNYLMFQST